MPIHIQPDCRLLSGRRHKVFHDRMQKLLSDMRRLLFETAQHRYKPDPCFLSSRPESHLFLWKQQTSVFFQDKKWSLKTACFHLYLLCLRIRRPGYQQNAVILLQGSIEPDPLLYNSLEEGQWPAADRHLSAVPFLLKSPQRQDLHNCNMKVHKGSWHPQY